MRKNWKGRKDMALRLIICVVAVLIAIGYIPIKHAVYADESIIYLEEIGELRFTKYFGRTSLNWYNNGKKYNNRRIVETTSIDGVPKLKESGISYIGQLVDRKSVLYFEVQKNSPLERLNCNFDPSKVKNYYAIKYYALNGDNPAEWKDGYYEKEIVITDWVPVYPIQRSGWLASKLLPKSYLTIWDYIG
jgi:hypothetical protein